MNKPLQYGPDTRINFLRKTREIDHNLIIYAQFLEKNGFVAIGVSVLYGLILNPADDS